SAAWSTSLTGDRYRWQPASADGSVTIGISGLPCQGWLSMTPLTRCIYDASQFGRTAWYLGHALTAARLSTPVPDDLPKGLPDRKTYLADLNALLRRDREHIAAGRYRMPDDLLPSGAVFRQSTRFLADLGRINLRRMRKDGQEVFRGNTWNDGGRSQPRYYLQNFHYQTDGWLSDHSADLYDFQVNVLFNGATDAMRRQALLPISEALNGRRIADLKLLDVACGTGRFLSAIKQNFPRLQATGLDLSRAYLEKTKKNLVSWSWWDVIEASAEQLPFADGAVDIVTSVYLLHELPDKVRRQVVREMTRVLKPNGRLILVDSLQHGDHPPFDRLLDLFPILYHEPYYTDYVDADLQDLFETTGMKTLQIDRAFMSKIMVFEKWCDHTI
ncbi:MAG: class I SAM-dependent methyltransferase, partial [Geminicoccaceae bacterium]